MFGSAPHQLFTAFGWINGRPLSCSVEKLCPAAGAEVRDASAVSSFALGPFRVKFHEPAGVCDSQRPAMAPAHPVPLTASLPRRPFAELPERSELRLGKGQSDEALGLAGRAEVQLSRGGDVTAPEAELPDELVRSRAGDAHAAAMNAVQVVSGTEADQVLGVVAASLRARLDVVRVHRGPAAARDLAEVPVTGADAALQRVRLLELLSPRVHEVLRQRHKAFSRPQPALRRRAGSAERGLDDLRDAHWHPDGKGPARAHLRLVVVLHRTTQRDAGHGLRLLDPALRLLSFSMPCDDARLLVADPLLAQRSPQERDPIQAELERVAAAGGALGHSQPLLAIVAEAGETERLPGAAALEHHRHMPEHLAPAAALLHQSLEFRVDAPWIDLPAELLRL